MQIAIIDTDPEACDILAQLFEFKGDVCSRLNEHSGLREQLAIFIPDVVIVSVEMNPIYWSAIVAAIRGSVPVKPIKVVALSGWDLERYKDDAKGAGFDFYFCKPVAFAELYATVLDR